MGKFTLKSMVSRVLSAGTYNVIVDSVKLKESRKDESLKDIMIVFKITEGASKNKTIVETIYNGAFGFKLAPFAEAVGMDFEKEYESMDEALNSLVEKAEGKELSLEVGIKTYNGNEYNEVLKFFKGNKSVTSEEEVANVFESEEKEDEDMEELLDDSNDDNDDDDDETII